MQFIITRNSRTIIDLVLINHIEKLECEILKKPIITDHRITITKINIDTN